MSTTQNKKFVPADGLAGLKQNFGKDALAGLLVFLLALPLSLGIAKASLFPMLFGLVTAIVGGVVVSIFMGSRLSIKGPAAGLIVIASGSVTAFGDGVQGWHLALGAAVVAGLIQILFGVFKFGKFADFFPGAAIHGMLAAIGIIIMAKQLHLILGINPAELKGMSPIHLLGALPKSIMNQNAHLAEIGLACLLIMIIMSFVKNEKIKKVPAPLVVLLVSIPLGFALHLRTDSSVANFSLVKIGSVADAFKDGIINVDFSGLLSHTSVFIQYVILYSLIGSIESLLTAKAVDGMDPYKRKTDYDKDLIGIGVGNTISGILGGLPMISEVARSSANVSYGAVTRWSNFFHGIFLLLAVAIAVPLIEMIPNVALAAMLVFVGFRLAHPKNFIHAFHIGKEQLLVFCVTVIITIATDLLNGVAAGIVLEFIINLLLGARFRNLFKTHVTILENNGTYHVMVSGDLLFSNLLGFKKKFNAIANAKKVELDFSGTKVVDHTSLLTVQKMIEEYQENGGTITMKGFERHASMSGDPTSTRVLKVA